jgi:hypothetical protein
LERKKLTQRAAGVVVDLAPRSRRLARSVKTNAATAASVPPLITERRVASLVIPMILCRFHVLPNLQDPVERLRLP